MLGGPAISPLGQIRTSSDLDVMSTVLLITDSIRTSFNVAQGPQTDSCTATSNYAAARLPRVGSRRPAKTTRPPTKAISSWRYYRFQHFGWLGPPHIGQSAPACCAVSTFALQLMILQFATPFCLQFWIKSASACAWVASAKSLYSYA